MQVRWKPADPDLSPFLSGVVERHDDRARGLSLELPLAHPLLQVTLGADYEFQEGDRFRPMPHLSLWGPSEHSRLTRPAGRIHQLVAVLTFRGVELLAPGLGRDLHGRRLDLVDRLGDDGGRLLHRLKVAGSFAARHAILQAHVRALLRARAAEPELSVRAMADRIGAGAVHGPIAGIAHSLGMNERTMRNHFRRNLGISPKRLQRIARLNRAMRALHPAGWHAGCDDRVRLEFFDDAHFHNEFRQLTGMSPRAFQIHKRRSGDPLVYSLPGAPHDRGATAGRAGLRMGASAISTA